MPRASVDRGYLSSKSLPSCSLLSNSSAAQARFSRRIPGLVRSVDTPAGRTTGQTARLGTLAAIPPRMTQVCASVDWKVTLSLSNPRLAGIAPDTAASRYILSHGTLPKGTVMALRNRLAQGIRMATRLQLPVQVSPELTEILVIVEVGEGPTLSHRVLFSEDMGT